MKCFCGVRWVEIFFGVIMINLLFGCMLYFSQVCLVRLVGFFGLLVCVRQFLVVYNIIGIEFRWWEKRLEFCRVFMWIIMLRLLVIRFGVGMFVIRLIESLGYFLSIFVVMCVRIFCVIVEEQLMCSVLMGVLLNVYNCLWIFCVLNSILWQFW